MRDALKFGFFPIIQVYSLFSASPYRWDILKKNVLNLTLKSVNEKQNGRA